MTEIDKPFHVSRSFAIVWGCLAASVGVLVFRHYHGMFYEKLIVTTLGSLYATFCLYGPILLARQVVRSGGRGRFVLQILLATLVGLALVIGGIALCNHGSVSYEATFLVTVFVFANLNEWLGNNRRT
jgi:hypothetical protein